MMENGVAWQQRSIRQSHVRRVYMFVYTICPGTFRVHIWKRVAIGVVANIESMRTTERANFMTILFFMCLNNRQNVCWAS